MERRLAIAALGVAIGLGACSAARESPAPAATSAPTVGTAPAPEPTVAMATAPSGLAPAGRVRNWTEFQRMAANRLVQANPGQTYMGRPPEPLLAIPVMEVELNANGTVRRVNVMRKPSQAPDTMQLAVNAIHRAAPYGDVSHLPRPWKFTEVFLFDDNRRFKPRTLD